MAIENEQPQKNGVSTEAQAQQMRASAFGSFNAEEIVKESEQVRLTNIDKSMINHGMVKLWNEKVRKKSEKLTKTINYERFLQVTEAFNVPDEVKLAYTNRQALFTSQSDDLILYFANLKANSIGEVSPREKRMIIAEAVNSVMFDLYEEVVDVTPSKITIAHLTMLVPFDSRAQGVNPIRERLSSMNINIVDYVFDALVKKSE